MTVSGRIDTVSARVKGSKAPTSGAKLLFWSMKAIIEYFPGSIWLNSYAPVLSGLVRNILASVRFWAMTSIGPFVGNPRAVTMPETTGKSLESGTWKFNSTNGVSYIIWL